MDEKKLFLIDGSALYYRAYFALMRSPLYNKKGENTSAAFGFLNQIIRLLQTEKPHYMAVVFDTKHPTFRHERYAPYKATREKMPEEMAIQFPRIVELVGKMGIKILEKPGFEADDIIGTLATQASRSDFTVYMVTADKDYMQLIKNNVFMYNPWSKGAIEILDIDGVKEKIGLRPTQVIDYLALMGDASDNIPGVKKVGPKTAVKLLKEFESLENLYNNLDKVAKESLRTRLEEDRDMAFLSKELVTIDIDTPLEVLPEDLVLQHPQKDALLALLEELEFTRFTEQLAGIYPQLFPKSGSVETVEKKYTLINTRTGLDELAEQLRDHDFWVFDTETTGLRPRDSEIIGLSFCWKAHEAYYLPLLDTGDLTIQSTIDKLKPLFEDPHIKKGGQNIKFDALMLSNYDIEVQGIAFDTMIADYLLNPGARGHDLDSLARKYLDYEMIPIEQLIGKKGKNQKNMAELAPEDITDYAAEDADITFRLVEELKPRLKDAHLLKLFEETEIPLISVLIDMEKAGVSLDLPFLKQLSQTLAEQIKKLVKQIYDLCGEEFNVNSTQQLGIILYEKLEIHKKANLKRVPKTAKGAYSTAESVLERMSGESVVDAILEYRKLTKLKNTYVDTLPDLVSPKTNRLHASFNQTVAATGRLSSSDPNLQNIPIRTEIGRQMRKAFIPGQPDWVILSADYSQIELRILAEMSGDKEFIEAFRSGTDIHQSTASKIFNIPPDKVTPDDRRKAKEINFGIIYGMNQYGLARRLHISPDEAAAIIKNYFAQFGNVQNYILQVITQATRKNYVETILGRKRYIPEIQSRDRNTRENAERIAINTTIQGSAADLIKKAMIDIHRELMSNSFQTRMLIQVHDELVFEIPEAELKLVKPMIVDKMIHAMDLSVPIEVDTGVGSNWLEAHE